MQKCICIFQCDLVITSRNLLWQDTVPVAEPCQSTPDKPVKIRAKPATAIWKNAANMYATTAFCNIHLDTVYTNKPLN